MTHLKVESDAVSIEGPLTRATVVAIRGELLGALAVAGPRHVRLVNVTSADSAGVQLLASLVKGFPALTLCDASEAVHAALVRMGATSLLGGVA